MKSYLEENFVVKQKLTSEKAVKRCKLASTATLCAMRVLEDYHKAAAKRRSYQIITERIFVVTNFVLEVPSAIFDQLSSNHKTKYILAATLMSVATLFICISELVYRGRKARVAWKWRHKIPWLYYPSPKNKPFGTFTDCVGLLSAIFQCIFTAISYVLHRRGINNPIQISSMPLVFAFCVLCSKFLKNSGENTANYSSEVIHLRMA